MGKGIIKSGGPRGIYTIDIEYKDGSLEQRFAWCADRTEDLSGTIATAEIPGDPDIVQVLPGWRRLRSQYTLSKNGILSKADGVNEYAAYFNRALKPAWQKYRPTYRHGIVKYVNKTKDYINVLLDSAESHEQGLNINQTTYLVNVPVEYMQCNASAFSVGDSCLVEFVDQDWDNPVVIGFKEEPKLCFWEPWTGPNGNSKNPWCATVSGTNYRPWGSSSVSDGDASISISNGECTMTSGGDVAFLYNYAESGGTPIYNEPFGIQITSGKLYFSITDYSAGDLLYINLYDKKDPQERNEYFYIDSIGEFIEDIALGTLDYIDIMCIGGSFTMDYITFA